MEKTQTIEIDCPPGYPRPGDLIADVLKDTKLPVKESQSRCFGNWVWNYNDITPDVWEKARPLLKERLEALYHQGIVRYCSW